MASSRLGTRGATLAYGRHAVAEQLTVDIPDGSLTVIVGPNACGKSTLLRALSRLIAPRPGTVVLDGRNIASYPAKAVARIVGLLPQSSTAPDGITVAELVAHGRYPHQSLLRQWSPADEAAVAEAMALTDTASLADRYVDQLSGGQRQRVWIAVALAQQTPILLLDEPTTFLDIAHQVEVMELCRDLHQRGRTLVVVLHDLNQACRYATHLIVMRDGQVHAQGHPSDIITQDLVREVFDLESTILTDPYRGTPLVVPAPGTWASRMTPSPRPRRPSTITAATW